MGDYEIFVETRKIKSILGEIEKIFDSKQGDLRLLIGPRGIGKSTLLNVITYKASLHDNAFGIKIEPDISSIKRDPYQIATHIFKIIYKNLVAKMGIRDCPEYSPENLKEVMEHYTRGEIPILPVFCIDELDKLNSKKDMAVINKFLKDNQNMLQRLKISALTIISCSPDWEFLNSKDLSYLDRENAIELDMLNAAEVKEIVERRLKTVSKNLNDVFTEDATQYLMKISEGNPRTLLSRCKRLCKEAFEKGKRQIDKELIESVYKNKIKQHIPNLINKIAESSPYFNQGLTKIWKFYQELEINKIDPSEGLKIFNLLVKNPRIEKRKIPGKLDQLLINAGCGYTVTNMLIEMFVLDEHVLEFFKQWDSYGYSINDFAENYAEKPIEPKLSEIDIYIQRKLSKYSSIKAKDFFSKSQQYYNELKEKYQNKTYEEIVILSWQVLEFFIKAEMISDGETPRIRTYLKKKAKRVKRNRIEYSYICPNPKCRKELRGTETACPECGKDLTEYDLRGELMNQFKDMLRRRKVYLSSYDDIDYCRKKRNNVLHTPRGRASLNQRIAEQCRQNAIAAFEEMLREFL